MKHHVILSLGSNTNREHNIVSAIHALQESFGPVRFSPVYESAAVGFEGDPFFNLAAEISCSEGPQALSKRLKAIEDDHGRDRKAAKFSGRTLDIDIVLFDTEVGSVEGIELPRPELYYNAFVLYPVADLLEETRDPKTQQSYRNLASQLSADTEQRLAQVEVPSLRL